jgi:CheY-like chemotaxis protein
MARILLIEDNAVVRQLLHDMLTAAGYDVLAEADGNAAIEALRRITVDAVVTDIYMPGMDGLETIVEVRKRYPDLRIIAMSGGSSRVRGRQADHLMTAHEIGADAVLRKPFEPEELIGALQRLLN